MIVKTESVILTARKQGDTSKIITVFSKDYGKISLIAKGARNSRNKFGASIEPLSISNLYFYMKPNTELYLLSNSEIETKLYNIIKNDKHLTCSFIISEVVNSTQLNKNPNNELYDLIKSSLIGLNLMDNRPESIYISFMFRFFDLMGFGFDMSESANCTKKVITIDIGSAMIMDGSFSSNEVNFKMSKILVDKLYQISSSEDHNNDISINQTEFITVNNFFQSYLSYHLETNFKLKSTNLIS
ncbi:DNA repair protein RecO [Candidatus Kapaibacterium sp.]